MSEDAYSPEGWGRGCKDAEERIETEVRSGITVCKWGLKNSEIMRTISAVTMKCRELSVFIGKEADVLQSQNNVTWQWKLYNLSHDFLKNMFLHGKSEMGNLVCNNPNLEPNFIYI